MSFWSFLSSPDRLPDNVQLPPARFFWGPTADITDAYETYHRTSDGNWWVLDLKLFHTGATGIYVGDPKLLAAEQARIEASRAALLEEYAQRLAKHAQPLTAAQWVELHHAAEKAELLNLSNAALRVLWTRDGHAMLEE